MSVLERRPDEGDIEYQKRLVYGKLVDKTLADYDYSEIAEYLYGKPYSSDVARRMMYGSRNTLDALENTQIDSIDDVSILNELEEKKRELQKEKQKFFDQRTAYNKLLRERSRQEELNEIVAETVMSMDLPEINYDELSLREDSDNDLLVSLNDMHYGAGVDSYWRTYDPEICQGMLTHYLEEIIKIGVTHQSKNCYVFCNGDVISGSIHHSITVTNKENVIKQIMGASELISSFLAKLSPYFYHVYFLSVAGNHSRLNPNKDDTLMDERLDDLVEWYATARLQNYDNVHFDAGEKIDPTMYLVDIRGKTYCGVHGDYDGSASKVQALQTMAGKPVYAVLSGHLHHNKFDEVQGIKTVMAGSFLGMDDYCVQKRIYGNPQQAVCVCDSDGIRCIYDIDL